MENNDEGNSTVKTRVSSDPADDKTVTYTWDHRNRLISITNKDNSGTVTQVVEHTYDVLDRRVSMSVDLDGAGPLPEQITRYIYSGTDILAISDESGSITRRMLHGPAVDQVFAIEDDSTGDTLWALSDQLGSVRDVVDSDGTVENHLVYDAYGNVVSETDTDVDFLYGFTGRERDEASGLNYHRARYFDTSNGRWMSQDPIGFKAGEYNLYRYVGNATTVRTDPSGLEAYQPLPKVNTTGTQGGTPVRPTGSGEAINIYGEDENHLYKDFATDPKYVDYTVERPGGVYYVVRPLTERLEEDSVSDMVIRHSPMYPVTWREIVRIAKPVAVLTIAGPEKEVQETWSNINELKIVNEFEELTFPRPFVYTHQRNGMEITEEMAPSRYITVQFGQNPIYIGPNGNEAPTNSQID
ncbi:RHS repeat-associated core domain-containing protein [Rhodopirellula sp. P2]|uniref:RHS repeat-associated core domain-containing protein n=1 Tax=Rhodopirellula sp. P2 TaxID=2127060 RepID=UPI0023688BEC|nr:RHS repeat-associated core domain-containing protein [Rhodopirellula sp. P2]WDQ17308.1 RHS repeat-associated core domain-containing protein [Rhodopirellula sp. P2]